MILANVIVATFMPYVMAVFFWFFVIPVEFAIFRGFQRSVVGLFPSLGLVILANVVSTLAGFIIIGIIPVPPGFTMRESRPEYFQGMVLGFVIALLLSWAIENWVINCFRRRFAFDRLSRTTGLANLASYLVVWSAMEFWY